MLNTDLDAGQQSTLGDAPLAVLLLNNLAAVSSPNVFFYLTESEVHSRRSALNLEKGSRDLPLLPMPEVAARDLFQRVHPTFSNCLHDSLRMYSSIIGLNSL